MIGSWQGRQGARRGGGGADDGRRAIIDIGSNTVRLVIYGGSPRAPIILFNEKVAAQLGLGVTRNGSLADENIAMAMRALARFRLILDDWGVRDVEAVATAAVREAANRDRFLAEAGQIGIAARVLSGREEADLSAWGVAGAFPGADGIVADLGGGSLELVRLAADGPHAGLSLPLGTLRLAALKKRDAANYRAALATQLKKAEVAKAADLYLVGGTWRAMAVHAHAAAGRPRADPHGLTMTGAEARHFAAALAKAPVQRLSQEPRITAMRAASLPDAAVLLQVLLKRLEPQRLIFSSWGLREGVLYAALPPAIQAQDPLLAGTIAFGKQHGVTPVFAARVAGWTARATRAATSDQARLRQAAVTLALAAMQVEPNLRVQHAVNWALYKRWVAITEAERAMIAATICGNGATGDLPPAVLDRAPRDDLERGYAWGLAIRLWRRLGGGSTQSLEATRLVCEEGRLVLQVCAHHAALIGPATEKDLRLLAGRLGVTGGIEVVPDDTFAAPGTASPPQPERSGLTAASSPLLR
ncbi:Ppx/GppA family phosphatase [Erythrobacteraceae bacterium CFH 75059]|uniref:Ppx/GppA phosphatase family protein n=1 Tax=Qipengyuania thermophila TaxID=2509361 RepID=UPI00101F1D18|nr:Ppx/GppA family phosphatase [Qipengyuania thermophila]TCD01880.1 Ppx/GppA family phosphatase [Erythrobacteraceae bacterium CFH 75059]